MFNVYHLLPYIYHGG